MELVVGLFDKKRDADLAVKALEQAGFSQSKLGALAQDRIIVEHLADEQKDATAKSAGIGALSGTALGGLTGLLAGTGAIVIPVIGPVIAAGVLASTLAGAGVGAAAGSLAGALMGLGFSEKQAQVYTEGVEQGGVMVAVQAEGEHIGLAREIIKQANAVDIETRGQEWFGEGWAAADESTQGVDPAAPNPQRPRPHY
jgi:uncharacterized membrane protein